jgi:DNA-binding XRE family transcriptional regulator
MRDATTGDEDLAQARKRRRLTQPELADRWRLSGRTLEAWRQRGVGPRWLRVGRAVRYPIEEVEAFEAGSLRGGR